MSTNDQYPAPPYGSPPPAAPETKKKSWFARHKILTGILGILLLFLFAGALSGEDDPAPAAATQTSSETAHAFDEEGTGSSARSQGSTADESAADDKAAKEKKAAEKKAAEEKAAEEAKAAGIGDTVTVGDFEVTVTGIQDGFDYVGPQDFGEKAQGQFVKVNMTVKNNGKSAEYFMDSDQKIIDEQDREHSTSSAGWLLDDESLWLTEINPGNTAEGAMLFDIPVDSSPVKIKLAAGWLDQPVEVSLKG